MIESQSDEIKTPLDLYLEFERYLNSTDARKKHFNNIQISMFKNIEARLGYESGSISDNIMNGQFSHYIRTLAIEEILSATSGKSKRFADRFLSDVVEKDYINGMMPVIHSMKGSRVRLIKVAENDPETPFMDVIVYEDGSPSDRIEVFSIASNGEPVGTYFSSRIHTHGSANFTTFVSLAITPEEVEISTNDRSVSEFDLWVERILEDDCKDCDNCKAIKKRHHAMNSEIMKLISLSLANGGAGEALIDEIRSDLLRSPLESTILSIEAGVRDPRKIGRVVQWIQNTEKEMSVDPDLAKVDTGWIWADLGIEQLRTNKLH